MIQYYLKLLLMAESMNKSENESAVVTTDGRLRFLLMEPGGSTSSTAAKLYWLDLETAYTHKFVDATYCSSVERICATTDNGELVFFKFKLIHSNQVRRNC